MRRTIFCVLVVLVIGIISSHVLMAVPQEDEDNYGKVIGQIVDPGTGEPVDEVFKVVFVDVNSTEILVTEENYILTDKKGFFTFKLRQGKYYVHITITRPDTNYCFEPLPDLSKGDIPTIEVKIGQITKLVKKACSGGKLKIVTVDSSGNRINIKEFFKKENFSMSLLNEDFEENPPAYYASHNSEKDEWVCNSMYPGNYRLRLSARTAGCGVTEMKNIVVNKNETSEVNLVIDTSTGIEGTIINQNGEPIKSVWIELRNMSDYSIVDVFTDENGYFKIISAKEGMYLLQYGIEINGFFYEDAVKRISIVKNNILNRKFILNTQ